MKKISIGAGVLLMAAAIFVSSSIPYDKQNIQPLLASLVDQKAVTRWLGWVSFQYGTKEISIANLGVPAFLEFFVRKAAHVISYAVLGVLVSRLLGAIFKVRGWKNALLAVGVAMLYAASDEIHQTFTSRRHGMLLDVWLDGIGAAIGILLTWKYINRPDRKRGAPYEN